MTLSTAGLKSLINTTRKAMKAGASYISDPKIRNALLADHGLDGVRVKDDPYTTRDEDLPAESKD